MKGFSTIAGECGRKIVLQPSTRTDGVQITSADDSGHCNGTILRRDGLVALRDELDERIEELDSEELHVLIELVISPVVRGCNLEPWAVAGHMRKYAAEMLGVDKGLIRTRVVSQELVAHDACGRAFEAGMEMARQRFEKQKGATQ